MNFSSKLGICPWKPAHRKAQNRQPSGYENHNYDFVLMITESIKQDQFSNTEFSQILTEISNKIAKTP